MITVINQSTRVVVITKREPLVVRPLYGAGARGIDGIGADVTVLSDAFNLHLIDPTPHPAYDDMIDLVVLFNNGIV